MAIRNVIIWSLLAMVPAALIGGLVTGLPGAKLAIGITVIFGMTAAVIVYALEEIEGNKKQNQ